jgi:SpoVK/Ycf46/Vps4 family AAA+-type ATPase
MNPTRAISRWTRTGTLHFDWSEHETLEKLALNSGLRERVTSLTQKFAQGREAYNSLRLPWRKGLFFFGPSGAGKTAATRCIARALNWEHFSIPAHEILDSHLMESAFSSAIQSSGRVIVLEDIDRMVHSMEPEDFFAMLDHAMERAEGTLWIATTKHPELSPKTQLIRPGRFDESWRFDLPTPQLRKEILMNDFIVPFFSTLSQDEDQLLTELVEETQGLSFAHFEELRQIAAQMKLEDRLPDFWLSARSYIQDQIISGDRWGGQSDKTTETLDRAKAVDARILEAALDMTDVFKRLMEKVIGDASEKAKTDQLENGN